jgi:ketosteroid isomerase-like protein
MKSFLIGTLVLVLLATSAYKNSSPGKDELMEAERQFSLLCMQSGMKVAFSAFMDSSAVLLRPEHRPIVGKAAAAFVENSTMGPGILSWVPSEADISASGDLGYTYGIYTVHQPSGDVFGTYTTIWKKNRKGEWKFVLDTGNPGIEQENK